MEAATSSKERPSSNASNTSELMEQYADGMEETDYRAGDEGVHRASIKTPLDRVMHLQKRVLKHEKPVKPKEGDEGNRSGSVCSIASNHSRKTQLKPPGLADSTTLKPEKRRLSDGGIRLEKERKRSVVNPISPSSRTDTVPRELIKTTIKPMNMPLAPNI